MESSQNEKHKTHRTEKMAVESANEDSNIRFSAPMLFANGRGV